MSESKTLYWHDYETWGEVPAQDRPSQFAGVRTDENLNIIGDPLMLYCRPVVDCLPKPEACLVTGITPQMALEKGVAEPEFIATIMAELGQPGTCGVGYNSIRFDDEVTRYTLYRNFYDPYEREWRNGNSRWDLIDVVRMTRALRPEGIQWPDYDNGKPCFKLEKLTEANGLDHAAAHDALSDVYATIAMARLVRDRQPKLYEHAYRLRDKRFAAGFIDIDGHRPLLHISGMYPAERGNAALVLPLALHPANKNSVLVFDLSESPEDLLSASEDSLRERLFTRSEDLPEGTRRPALKEVHLNKTPMIAPANTLDERTARRLGIDKAQAEVHWRQLADLTLSEQQRLRAKLQSIYRAPGFEPRTDPDQQLYDGFFDDHDKKLMTELRRAQPEALAANVFDFHDQRLPELLFRYRGRHFPDSLSDEERRQWRDFCYRRLTDPAAGAGLTWDQLLARLGALRAEGVSAEQERVLVALEHYARGQLDAMGS
ncbi:MULTISPECIES: exodeoxyribonuclease I [unclassified Marinimicrobium]|uniref:exodeoxyribonuclease I n=1 Tax=Marinimicrobium TaxID=359337 RepID=UPI000C359338|nr:MULTISPECIES: exodeoxyribonuclease I [unclassified Marinimicrobium]MAN52210.1 exodeoxyribonuclease I [Marinimicrobium sp.]